MKTKIVVLAMLIITSGIHATAQDKVQKNYIFSYEGKKKTHTIGAYAALSGTASEVSGKTALWAGAKLGVVLDHRYTLGVAAYGLSYDHSLTALVDDGKYHLEAGYTGLFFEYMQPLGKRFLLGFSVLTGQGTAKYTYDKDYRENKAWYEQTIDLQNFSVIEPGIEALIRVNPRWSFGINGSFRSTSPVRLKNTSTSILTNMNAGLSVRFGIY